MMDLLQLRYFCAAAKTENFSRVAEQFYVPQSAVSRTISRLEKELGVSLFDRRGKRVMLNAKGRLFLRHVDEALTLLDNGVMQVSGKAKERISLTMLAGSRLMPPVLAGFHAQYPQVEISLMGEPVGGTAACVLRHLPVPEEWSYTPLLTEKLMLAVSRTHPLATRHSVTPEELQGEEFILFSKQKELRAVTDRAFDEIDLHPPIYFECDDVATFRGMVENGLGLALVPEYTWKTSPSDAVVLLPVEGLRVTRTLVLAWNKSGGSMTYGAKLFCRYCERWFSHL